MPFNWVKESYVRFKYNGTILRSFRDNWLDIPLYDVIFCGPITKIGNLVFLSTNNIIWKFFFSSGTWDKGPEAFSSNVV